MGPKSLYKKKLTVVEALIEFAQSRNHTILELAFAWSNVAAIGWRLTGDELAEIDQVTSGI
jgi:aryl-alcohol dehydrogenase-like predicted oxidoreductase